MSIIIPANSAVSGGFDVTNSLMFNRVDSAYLSRSQGTATLAYKYTLSMWIKRSDIGAEMYLTGVSSGTVIELMKFTSTNTLEWYNRDAASNVSVAVTKNAFTDLSSWYHLVFSYDSSQSTPATQKKLYINGVEQTFASNVGLATNAVPGLNLSGANIKVGAEYSPNYYYDGYMSEVNFIDGQALAADSFGEFDEDSGVWKPINASGLTFGNNGFYLDFKDSANLGNDASGGTDFSESNIAATDQGTDTCTNNFCTLTTLVRMAITLNQGNTQVTDTDSAYYGVASTMGVSSGKWYWEYKLTRIGNYAQDGVMSQLPSGNGFNDIYNTYVGSKSGGVALNTGEGKIYSADSSTTWFGSANSQGQIIGVALDLDNNKIYYSADGTFGNSSNPATNSNGFALSATIIANKPVLPCTSINNCTLDYNFGSPYYAISSGNSDADGHGNFEYAVPSGYFALCTKNLAEYG